MSQKIRSFLVSLATGFLFIVLALATEAVMAKIYFHPFAIAISIVLWFFYSLLLWGGFFKDIPQGAPFLSRRLFKSFAVGLFAVLVILVSMFLVGKVSGPHPLVISEVKNISALGVVFIWISIACLLFEGVFKPNNE